MESDGGFGRAWRSLKKSRERGKSYFLVTTNHGEQLARKKSQRAEPQSTYTVRTVDLGFKY